MAKQSRYSIEIKDETGKTFTFTADWTVDQRRLAIAQFGGWSTRRERLQQQGRRAIEWQASLRHERQHVTGPSVVNTHQACKPLPQR